ncbi:PREDICTED: phosphoinositide 3-kinase regulatory subunit 4-like [Amphimedon queenslandica]|nr:PREDICTED: phosphoinositide 3-kinase regulatory subunit 4-like [Amphimedon queenslandica]|eukprot:XP_019859703.1 PREDICTED: phosphoinositide 3-kinase regulatory subunit 4-like [Amphimedon queenslandica]
MFSDSVQVSSPPSDSIKLSPTLQHKVASKSFSVKSKDNLLMKQSELTYSSEKIDELKGSSGGHRRTKSDSGTESRSVVVFDKPPSLVRVEQTTCMENLQSLLNHKKELYKKDMQGMDKGYLYYPFYQAPASWAPKGQLVAHIHDHLQAVNKIKVIPDSTYFVSFSDDSTTKIWDVNKMEGLHVINKPRLVYSQQGGKIKTGCYCMGNQSIVAASSNGTIHAFNIDREPNSKQKALKAKDVLRWELDPSLHGSVVEMTEMTCGGQNVLAFVTTKGHLCGLDLRTPNLAWDLENDPRHGLMLSMALDPFQNWIALGTSLGYHIVWDMRFQLPICNWKHEGHGRPYVHRIQQLSSHPNQLQTVLSAASGNNEISVWDMETSTRRQMLWASPTQPFGPMTENPQQHNSVRALHTCVVGNDPVLLTGGTDRFIRLWHLNNPSESSCIVKAGVGSEKIDISYSSQVIEGVEVLRELKTASRGGGGGGSTGGDDSTESHVMSHVDCITSLAVIPYKSPQNLTQQFIISASRDGIIKLWK